MLGADFRAVDGHVQISRVLIGDPWNPASSSPLTLPGVNVRAGEYLLKVDGRTVEPNRDVYGAFPFETKARDVWNTNQNLVTTNDADSDNVLELSGLASRVGHNVEYFLIGRHFGFVCLERLAARIEPAGDHERFLGREEPIPDKNVVISANVVFNPDGAASQWQQFAIAGAQTKELFDLSSKVARQTIESMNSAAAKSFEQLKR